MYIYVSLISLSSLSYFFYKKEKPSNKTRENAKQNQTTFY